MPVFGYLFLCGDRMFRLLPCYRVDSFELGVCVSWTFVVPLQRIICRDIPYGKLQSSNGCSYWREKKSENSKENENRAKISKQNRKLEEKQRQRNGKTKTKQNTYRAHKITILILLFQVNLLEPPQVDSGSRYLLSICVCVFARARARCILCWPSFGSPCTQKEERAIWHLARARRCIRIVFLSHVYTWFRWR